MWWGVNHVECVSESSMSTSIALRFVQDTTMNENEVTYVSTIASKEGFNQP